MEVGNEKKVLKIFITNRDKNNLRKNGPYKRNNKNQDPIEKHDKMRNENIPPSNRTKKTNLKEPHGNSRN